MDDSFDKAYARYLGSLAKLDTTDDISEKRLMFRQLAAQLSQMEDTLKTLPFPAEPDEVLNKRAGLSFWS